MNITFIGGGNMANAIIGGLMKQGQRAPTVRVVEIDAAARARLTEQYAIKTFDRIDAAAVAVDCIVLAIKPQNMREVATALRPHVKQQLVISIAAGIRGGDLARWLGGYERLVRAMPNTPALVGAGATAIAPGKHAGEADLATAKALFDAVGITVVLDEHHLDAVTGLSGSGPAYIFLILEALSDAGVKVGLSRRNAQQLAAQTVLGSAKMLLETDEHVGKLKDMVTSPGGTAIAGLHTLEEGGLRTTLINAVETATKRARELGRGGK
jgi:pyrroline-5-carboxylate reductase